MFCMSFIKVINSGIECGGDYLKKLSKRIAEEIAEWEGASRRNKAHRIIQQVNVTDPDIRRQIIIGSHVLDFMPEFIRCQPKQTEAENLWEFRSLCNILEWISRNRDTINQSIERDTDMLNEAVHHQNSDIEGEKNVKST